MKLLIIATGIFFSVAASAQKDELCFVRSIMGIAKKRDSTRLLPGDTIHASMLRQLVLNPASAVVNLQTVNGPASYFRDSTQFLANQKISSRASEKLEDLAQIFRVKGSNIQLSSRGGCDEVLNDCLKTDPGINDKILIIDTLSLPLPESQSNGPVKYFLQWKHAGSIYNNILKVKDNRLIITASDLDFSGMHYIDSETVKLGIVKYNDAGRYYSDIARVKLCITTSRELTDYYATLVLLQKDATSTELFNRFYKEVYIFYGKPDICVLKSLVHFTE